ncbi:NAD(FAD)-dependent dehydrogenase [Desulfosporosinus orientis DSM 765]|uniref:NAD(FAD)-dependent dehydrogenase n=1 Tax=Desulfosporosinus orientis (strain ATCC 19365 / DSM 765 / NCIMB 8382 / VKM B-1628 / Singapore I) TaxID=768706 RepID=G7W5P4_DESOD|nr:FAD-dependent oxidoreductase [Desulfosporosinus orientis]AET66982.1 NAD(FAD)-dependent dehydrogenase [Desulfosporosinus orientis DSM 765]
MNVIIVGGVAIGPKVAARLRRISPEAVITIIERGSLISYGGCGLPLYVGNLVPKLDDLMMTSYGVLRDSEFFRKQKNINVRTQTEALKIDRGNKTVLVRDLVANTEEALPYDYLILATGAKPSIPPIPGVDLGQIFTFHHPQDAQKVKELIKLKKIKHVTIIGSGLIGIETADALASPRLKVTVCEADSRVLPKLLDSDMSKLVEQKMKGHDVELLLSCKVKGFEGDAEGNVCRVVTEQGTINTEAVIIATGVRPEISLAQEAGLTIGNTGAIKVDEHQLTSDPAIYAGGDCTEQRHLITEEPVYIPLASTANKQGRVIADHIAGLPSRFAPVEGTSILQAFDFNIGRTGLSEEEARKRGYNVVTSVSSGLDATHYYPMHGLITIKLIAEHENGRLLGAQVCGIGESAKRLDVLVTALKFGAKVKDLIDLDLAYAPPFATAIDVLIHAATTLENIRRGIAIGITAEDVTKRLNAGEKLCILDIREPDEVAANPLAVPGTMVIGLGELRERWKEIPRDCLIVTVCGLGIRGYEAACMLQAKGITQVAFLEGGLNVGSAFFKQ